MVEVDHRKPGALGGRRLGVRAGVEQRTIARRVEVLHRHRADVLRCVVDPDPDLAVPAADVADGGPVRGVVVQRLHLGVAVEDVGGVLGLELAGGLRRGLLSHPDGQQQTGLAAAHTGERHAPVGAAARDGKIGGLPGGRVHHLHRGDVVGECDGDVLGSLPPLAVVVAEEVAPLGTRLGGGAVERIDNHDGVPDVGAEHGVEVGVIQTRKSLEVAEHDVAGQSVVDGSDVGGRHVRDAVVRHGAGRVVDGSHAPTGDGLVLGGGGAHHALAGLERHPVVGQRREVVGQVAGFVDDPGELVQRTGGCAVLIEHERAVELEFRAEQVQPFLPEGERRVEGHGLLRLGHVVVEVVEVLAEQDRGLPVTVDALERHLPLGLGQRRSEHVVDRLAATGAGPEAVRIICAPAPRVAVEGQDVGVGRVGVLAHPGGRVPAPAVGLVGVHENVGPLLLGVVEPLLEPFVLGGGVEALVAVGEAQRVAEVGLHLLGDEVAGLARVGHVVAAPRCLGERPLGGGVLLHEVDVEQWRVVEQGCRVAEGVPFSGCRNATSVALRRHPGGDVESVAQDEFLGAVDVRVGGGRRGRGLRRGGVLGEGPFCASKHLKAVPADPVERLVVLDVCQPHVGDILRHVAELPPDRVVALVLAEVRLVDDGTPGGATIGGDGDVDVVVPDVGLPGACRGERGVQLDAGDVVAAPQVEQHLGGVVAVGVVGGGRLGGRLPVGAGVTVENVGDVGTGGGLLVRRGRHRLDGFAAAVVRVHLRHFDGVGGALPILGGCHGNGVGTDLDRHLDPAVGRGRDAVDGHADRGVVDHGLDVHLRHGSIHLRVVGDDRRIEGGGDDGGLVDDEIAQSWWISSG